MTKEAILKKAYEGKLYSCPGDNEIRQAMDEYAASLLKENEELKEEIEELQRSEILLQAKCDSIEYWKARCEAAEKVIINERQDGYSRERLRKMV